MSKSKLQEATTYSLRPGITNPALGYPERPSETEWKHTRRVVLERDNYTCRSCGHRALKNMHLHHLEESDDNTPDNLATTCVACHAVLHFGRNLSLQTIEIWKSPFSQVEIIQKSRAGIGNGLSLAQINKNFKLKTGQHPPASIEYANDLAKKIKKAARAHLPEPLSVVFVNFKSWQLE
jgi:hypothetical protein